MTPNERLIARMCSDYEAAIERWLNAPDPEGPNPTANLSALERGVGSLGHHPSGSGSFGPCSGCGAEARFCRRRIDATNDECCTACLKSAGRTHR